MTFIGWRNELEETEWNFTETHGIIELEKKNQMHKNKMENSQLVMESWNNNQLQMTMCQQCDVAAKRQM